MKLFVLFFLSVSLFCHTEASCRTGQVDVNNTCENCEYRFSSFQKITAGGYHTCALLDDNTVKCWGRGFYGQLGYDSIDNVGDGTGTNMADLDPVILGDNRTATQISAGNSHTCALLDDRTVKCWGSGYYGRLGYDSTDNKGDSPGEMVALGSILLNDEVDVNSGYSLNGTECTIQTCAATTINNSYGVPITNVFENVTVSCSAGHDGGVATCGADGNAAGVWGTLPTCVTCDQGTYSVSGGACTVHSTACTAGNYVGTGSTTADTCTTCPSGQFQPNANSDATSCTHWSAAALAAAYQTIGGCKTR